LIAVVPYYVPDNGFIFKNVPDGVLYLLHDTESATLNYFIFKRSKDRINIALLSYTIPTREDSYSTVQFANVVIMNE